MSAIFLDNGRFDCGHIFFGKSRLAIARLKHCLIKMLQELPCSLKNQFARKYEL